MTFLEAYIYIITFQNVNDWEGNDKFTEVIRSVLVIANTIGVVYCLIHLLVL